MPYDTAYGKHSSAGLNIALSGVALGQSKPQPRNAIVNGEGPQADLIDTASPNGLREDRRSALADDRYLPTLCDTAAGENHISGCPLLPVGLGSSLSTVANSPKLLVDPATHEADPGRERHGKSLAASSASLSCVLR